jgi:hypothetical protein
VDQFVRVARDSLLLPSHPTPPTRLARACFHPSVASLIGLVGRPQAMAVQAHYHHHHHHRESPFLARYPSLLSIYSFLPR